MTRRVQELKIGNIGPSLNEYGRMHYRQRTQLVDTWNSLVAIEALKQGLKPVEIYPVTVEVECYFGTGRRRFDWDNLSPTAKLIQDELVHLGIIRNDSPPHVRGGACYSLSSCMDESYTIFRIIEQTRYCDETNA